MMTGATTQAACHWKPAASYQQPFRAGTRASLRGVGECALTGGCQLHSDTQPTPGACRDREKTLSRSAGQLAGPKRGPQELDRHCLERLVSFEMSAPSCAPSTHLSDRSTCTQATRTPQREVRCVLNVPVHRHPAAGATGVEAAAPSSVRRLLGSPVARSGRPGRRAQPRCSQPLFPPPPTPRRARPLVWTGRTSGRLRPRPCAPLARALGLGSPQPHPGADMETLEKGPGSVWNPEEWGVRERQGDLGPARTPAPRSRPQAGGDPHLPALPPGLLPRERGWWGPTGPAGVRCFSRNSSIKVQIVLCS
ncbi:uncharacterized protein LOC128589795 [Nycticebus coucang]|uniref:uncharacterized protein LOC128589795 n=1 Tax=Nycticebus coucang TaxID=9470 RepID=UPI00234C4E24|nr:uncharacterized protein LOC128589795 [Nycticebus coucang]